MKYFSNLLSFTAAVMVSTSVAYAADLPAPVFVEEPELPQVQIGGGWYLRGDIGYKVYRDPKVFTQELSLYDEKLDGTGVVGAGVGYRFNDFIRTDLTVDYEWDSDFFGKSACGGACSYAIQRSKIDVWTILFNAYADLGNYNGFMPYLGAGVGVSYVNVHGGNFANPSTGHGKYPGGNKWNLSWALMAGVGYDINENWKIDAGYRYLDIGEVETKKFDRGGGKMVSVKYEDLAAHEVRVGLRYEFGGSSYGGYDEPIMTKY
ncbi:outer membrane protein [Pseudovibrio sp. Tun.PSC04-5.I4]|uniref:outer membrane protein n=1 Tax=Pseudovibrio sp. Tun.PSC04-5.I4 TaxID=1798213 RepID=UPI00087F16DE|nr:outer membrane protein [Pseudovibrio sp. Tun.PSC04-5.I4]SDR32949.1 outer membrane insertion C-terminal signal [Pseudovibrio sp. Tun.PSC04-5.I4]